MIGLFLTLLKPFNAGITIYCIFNGYNYQAAGILMWLMLCDILDGFLFSLSALLDNKKLSLFRRIFNTVGDYVSVQMVLMVMIVRLDFPLYLYSIEVIREISLLAVWLYGYWIKKPLMVANLPARISIFSVGLMAAAWLTLPELAKWIIIPVIVFGILGTRQHYLTTKSKA